MAFLPKFPVPPLFHRSSRPDVIARQQTSMSLTNKGLLNPSGHNNCFLNSCVQVLWHVDVFRRSFREFEGHTCVGHSCIFCALKALFNQFQHSSQSALPPDELRQALARCYQEQHRFQLGLMDDAAECFEKILEQIHFHLTGSDDLDSCSAPHCLPHQKCALSVLEMTECTCGETSEPLAFIQFVHYISAPSLGAAAKRKRQEASYSLGDGGLFGSLVRSVSGEGEGRECGTCHRVSSMKKMLLNSPDLVCIGMIWDSDQPGVEDIMNVVESVGTILRVSDMFHRVMSDASSTEYWLGGMVAYYGHHYCTFCYHTVLRQWGFFDDANFRTISSNWSDVVQLCRKAHYQPLLLVYTNPFAEKITMTTAPTEVTKVTDHRPKSLSPVTEVENETKHTTQPPSEQASVGTAPPPSVGLTSPGNDSLPSSSVSTNTSVAAASTSVRAASTGAQSHSSNIGTKSAPDPAYEIDPNTLSIRPVGRETNTSHHLSGVRDQRRGEERGTSDPVPSAPPPLHAPSSFSPQRTATNVSPVVQTSAGKPKPATSLPHPSPSFPVLFQASPSAPLSQSQYTSPRHPSNAVSRPPYHPHPSSVSRPAHQQPLPPSQPTHPYYQPSQRTYYPTNAHSAASTGYPAPTYQTRQPIQSRSQTNAGYVYPNATTQSQSSSPYRGQPTARSLLSAFGNVLQAHPSQTQPQTSFFQSNYQLSPTSSPSSSRKLTPAARTAGYTSLPGSPAKTTTNHPQRASSVQPGTSSTHSPARLSSIARPRPSPPRSVPPPNEEEKSVSPQPSSYTMSTNSTPGGSTDNLIEFSLSPALLNANKSNQDQSPQGRTPLYPSPDSSSVLSTSTYSSSSRELSPHTLESELSIASLEGDLIQWSLTPDMIQKVQRYRSRQRQSSTDSINLSGRSGAKRATGNPSETHTAPENSAAITGLDNKLGLISEQVYPTDSKSNSVGSSGLVDVSGSTQTTGNDGEGGKVGVASGGQRERGESGVVDLPPDPLYADPDVVHTMLKSIAGTTAEEGGENSTTISCQEAGSGVERNGDDTRPGLGEDPLYAVPKQVMARMIAKQDMITAQSVKDGNETVSSSSTPSSTTTRCIPASVEPVLREALEAWRKAESKRDSNITLARISYSRAATLLMKVLLDPAVAQDQSLRHNISQKREEALSKCEEMNQQLYNQLKQRSTYGGSGTCTLCGQMRQLNSQQMCGPCHLKNKISQT